MLNRVVLVQSNELPGNNAATQLLMEKPLCAVPATLESLQKKSAKAAETGIIIGIAVCELEQSIEFFERLNTLAGDRKLIAVVSGTVGSEVLQSIAALVDDFVLWPAHEGEIEQRVRRQMARTGSAPSAVAERLMDEVGFGLLVGRAPAFLQVLERIPVIASTGQPVLISGETGTGKELSARAIHQLSPRRDFPFIAVDCGALPEHLVENELFGHSRGAFTDAYAEQKGLISLAEKGTLFLDEIDALPLSTQAKLLRFLQERTYKPLGAERFIGVDVNILAASNRDLEALVKEKQLRADLYYRINVFRLKLPPLRERQADIALLARHFIGQLCGNACPKVLSSAAAGKLEAYAWPGNVRELFNVMQQAVAFSGGPEIMPDAIMLPGVLQQKTDPRTSLRAGRAQAIERFEKAFIEELLRKHSGNVTHAALEARKDRRSFGRLMRKYDISRDVL